VDADEQRGQFVRTILHEDLDLHDVWLEYFAMTGTASEEEVALYAVEMVMLSQAQRDLLALAADESAHRAGIAFHHKFNGLLRHLEDHGGNHRGDDDERDHNR
jgi:hypothetical protein